MRTNRTIHLARSLVVFLSALLVLAGAGFAAARTLAGPPSAQPLLSAESPCDGTTDGTTEGTTDTSTDESADDPATDESGDTNDDSTDVSGDAQDDSTDESADDPTTDEQSSDDTEDSTDPSTTDCTSDQTDQTVQDETQKAADAQAYFDDFSSDCGSALLGDTKLTADGTDPAVVDAYSSLADSLDLGQVDHMVQSVRVLLKNCEDHANDGLKTALYHHGLNWLRHYDHELWLEQKFADKWPDGKPGGGHESDATHGKPDKPEKEHGNPHDADPSWAPGGGSSYDHGNGQGNGFGHS